MHDMHESSEQAPMPSRDERPGRARQNSGVLSGPSSILFWFAASGAVWIALVGPELLSRPVPANLRRSPRRTTPGRRHTQPVNRVSGSRAGVGIRLEDSQRTACVPLVDKYEHDSVTRGGHHKQRTY